jgi:peptide/nickel transport system substrate-binding protein
MADPSESGQSDVKRRRFIQLAGLSGATALAGCSGGGGGSGGGDNGSGGGSGAPAYFARTNQVPTQIQWNPLNPSSSAQYSQPLLFDAFAKYNHGTGEFMPYAIPEWSFSDDNTSLTMTIRDGLTWANGDDVTTEDILTQLRLGKAIGTSYASYTDSIEGTDDSTVVMNFSRPVNQTIVEFQVLGTEFVQMKASVFGKYLDQIEQNEDQGLRSLQNFAWQEPIASGPFELDSISPQQVVTKLRDDHPDSGEINFDTYTFKYISGGNQGVYQAMNANQIDGNGVFAPPRIIENLPDSWQQTKFPAGNGYGLVAQHDDKHAGDRAVRQAIAYVLNRKQIQENAGPASKTPVELTAGVLSTSIDEWIGDAQGSFTEYGMSSSMTQKATQVLEDAGYSKQGGTWTDSDGQTVSLPVQVPSDFSDWVTATQTVVDQLNSFGFESSVDGRSFGNLQGSIWPNGDFVLASGDWLAGGGKAAFPYFTQYQMMIENYRGFTYNYPAAASTRGGNSGSVTVPSRSGSGTMEVTPSARLTEMAQSTEQSQVQDVAVKLGWTINQDLPMIPVMEKQQQEFLTHDVWDVPEAGSDPTMVRDSYTWLPRMGKITYTGE